ncbi:hypothetical protein [Escherichia phage P762]|nr:hypothetical protein [Escherichia phage P762]
MPYATYLLYLWSVTICIGGIMINITILPSVQALGKNSESAS